MIPIPENIPVLLQPGAAILEEGTWNTFIDGNIRGNWTIVFLYFIVLFFNIVGEEVLWRGYLLPRQELTSGKTAWFFHGLMWTTFHAFKWWDLLNIFPICMVIAFVSQRTQRNWPAFIAHLVFNGTGFVLVIALVAGWL